MLPHSLRSCFCFGDKPFLLARRHSRRIDCHSTLLSLSLSPFNSKSKPLSPGFVFSDQQHSRTITMSSRPSAFDALMSGARAAAAKNKPQQSKSSPKKRKTLDSSSTTKATLITKIDSESPSQPQGELDSKPQETNADQDVNDSAPISSEVVPSAKKQKADTVKEKVVTLKSKISQLKKKPNDFDPKSVASWEKGEPVPFLFLALAFDMIDQESGRIVITDIACNMLRTVMYTTPDDLVPVVYLSANSISPPHEGLELGLGDASIIKALAEAFGRTEAQIKSQYKEKGDLGLVAKASRSSQSMMRKPDPLTISKVFDTFRSIAKESGKDSQDKKKNHIKALLVAATDCEPQYLIRLLQAKLRIGLAEQTLLAALGQAASFLEHSKPSQIVSPMEEASKIVKQVYSVLPSYDKIVPALLASGVWDLPKTCDFTLGVPIGPMLAKSTKSISEILDKFQDMEFTCEYKYDGERAQIHYMENGSVEIYSRNAEWNTGKFPDVVAAVPRFKKPSVSSFVIDCELVAYDRKKQKILPFQVLSTRARKNVVMSDIKVEVCVFAFDILYLNGQPLIQEQLKVRRESLYDSFEEETGVFQFATAITSNDVEAIQKFLDDSVEASCEGLIIKTLDRDATYEPSKRSNNWLKLKKDYIENIGDSLDLVPIAAFHGRGKRTGVYGAFLLACYDSNNEEYQSICKIGTGLSEALLEERSASLRSKLISMPKPYYRTRINPAPDVWFEPSEVWEVKAADLTISPVHRAAVGIVDADKGISLRFPRYVRIREDKTPEEASTSDQVAEMYNAQNHNLPNYQDEVEDD